MHPLLESCRGCREPAYLTVAVLGRFKAGKSSFITHLLGLDLLPAGVVPVHRLSLQREAEARLENLIATVERLASATQREAPQIRADLEQRRR